MDSVSTADVYWPLGVYFFCVLAIASGMLGVSYLLGARAISRRNVQPYESGVTSTGSARVRLPNDFYLFAVFFVIFDLESVVLYTWSISVLDAGWAGYATIVVFVGALAASLGYLWRVGALDTDLK
jgi:NADH-quinone oxidoreductase subunit A